MSKIVVVPDKLEHIKELLNNDFYILVGVQGYSVNTLNIGIKEIKELLTNTNKIFVSLNKNILNSELDKLEQLLIELNSLNIMGVFYYDVAILNIVKRLKLNINLIWSAEHLTTNYFTINYWYNEGVKSCFLSNEITKNEIIDIARNTNSKLFVQLFGYIPMYVSKRHAIKNYLKYFKKDVDFKQYFLYKENKKYSIVDNDEGTMIYSSFILNGLRESIQLKDDIDFIVVNGYRIETDKLLSVVNMFTDVNMNNIDNFDIELHKMFNNLEKGFLYEETIYRVK